MKQIRHDLIGTPPLREEEVAFLERLLNKERLIESSVGFIVDDKVVVTEGPLAGLESFIKFIDRHKRIAILEVKMFNEVKEIKVSLEIISKV